MLVAVSLHAAGRSKDGTESLFSTLLFDMQMFLASSSSIVEQHFHFALEGSCLVNRSMNLMSMRTMNIRYAVMLI